MTECRNRSVRAGGAYVGKERAKTLVLRDRVVDGLVGVEQRRGGLILYEFLTLKAARPYFVSAKAGMEFTGLVTHVQATFPAKILLSK